MLRQRLRNRHHDRRRSSSGKPPHNFDSTIYRIPIGTILHSSIGIFKTHHQNQHAQPISRGLRSAFVFGTFLSQPVLKVRIIVVYSIQLNACAQIGYVSTVLFVPSLWPPSCRLTSNLSSVFCHPLRLRASLCIEFLVSFARRTVTTSLPRAPARFHTARFHHVQFKSTLYRRNCVFVLEKQGEIKSSPRRYRSFGQAKSHTETAIVKSCSHTYVFFARAKQSHRSSVSIPRQPAVLCVRGEVDPSLRLRGDINSILS